ncbi:MAG: hypothetical protein AABX86_02350 [Nanoarchaeota archaeon]
MQARIALILVGLFLLYGCVEQPDVNKDLDALKLEVKELHSKLSSLETKTAQMLSAAKDQIIHKNETASDTVCNGDYSKIKSDFLHVREQLKTSQEDYLDEKKSYVLAQLAFEKAEQDIEDRKGNQSLGDLEDERDRKEEDRDDKKKKVDRVEDEMNGLENLFEQLKAEFLLLSQQCEGSFVFEDEACMGEQDDAQNTLEDFDQKIEDKEEDIDTKEEDIDEEKNASKKEDLEDERDDLVYARDQLKAEQDVAEEHLSFIRYRCVR